MEDIVVKPVDPIASCLSLNENQPKQANTLDRRKVVGLFCRYPREKNPTAKPRVNTKPEIEVELAEVKDAWQRYRSTNSRDAVYFYLEAVFALVMRWRRFNSALKNSRAALRLQSDAPKMKPEPFAIVIFCTSDADIADAKTRSKWSRVLRYARKAKPTNQRLTDFIKSKGGLNECARLFSVTR
jgi:hypothetical protein